MRRLSIYIYVFLFTLSLGLAGASLYESETKVVLHQVNEPERREVIGFVPEGSDDGFVPEFRDLPNFEGIDAPDRLKTKLIDMSETGDNYRPEELPAKSGESWLGLYWKNERLEFRRTKIKIIKETRPNYGHEGSVTFGYPHSPKPLFLVKGNKDLRIGEITTLAAAVESVTDPYDTIKDKLTQGFNQRYELNGRKYALRVTKGVQLDGGRVNVLVLESDSLTQLVTFNLHYKDQNTVYDSIGELLWAGDMDLDGKLDLYISDFGFEKGGFGSQLFLSSEAEPGTLLKLSAVFSTASC